MSRLPFPSRGGRLTLEETYWEARVYSGWRLAVDEVPEHVQASGEGWQDAQLDRSPRRGYAYGLRCNRVGPNGVEYWSLVRKNIWGA